jgi:hypothetical protein
MTVDLWECMHCHLLWVNPAIPTHCPSCRAHHNVPVGEIRVAGRDVRVNVLRDYGRRDGLLSKQVRRGLDRLELGHCPHGMVSATICPEC